MSRVACALLALLAASATAQTRTIVGQHDDAPLPSAILDRLETAGQSGWVTVAVGIGTNPADMSGFDFSALAADGHEVIVRLNAGFFPTGTIPVPSQYSDFATRCANAVANSTGAAKWLIGNETNLAVEWPQSGGGLQYISPASYAECFRECFDAIKAVDANAEVLVQSIAPWGGPYGPGNLGGFAHVGQPDTWIDYLHRVLDEIDALGVTPDGLTLHSGSRGYDPATVFNDTSRITAGPLNLAFGWEVHREWIMFGIPPEMWELPIYVTESNGLYWWKGGGPESGSDPAYQAGWLQGLYGAANAWNQSTRRSGMPPILCLNLYRWGPFDDWGIQALASGNPSISAQFLADMGAVVASQFTAPHQGLPMAVAIPGGENVAVGAVAAADTQLNASNAASRAVDGVIASGAKWTSTNGALDHWLRVDLGTEQPVTGFRVHHAQAGGESAAFNTRLLRLESATSATGPWRLEGARNTLDANGDSGGDESVTSLAFPSTRWLRHVRLFIADSGVDNFARIPEFETFAHTAPATQTLDNRDLNFTFEAGDWSRGTSAPGKFGTDYHFIDTGTGANSVRWTPALVAGPYEVQVWYTEGANRATDAHFEVTHAGGANNFTVNQETGGGAWNTLGTFTFSAGTGGHVTLTDESSEPGQVVIADAVRFVPVGLPVGLSVIGTE